MNIVKYRKLLNQLNFDAFTSNFDYPIIPIDYNIKTRLISAFNDFIDNYNLLKCEYNNENNVDFHTSIILNYYDEDDYFEKINLIYYDVKLDNYYFFNIKDGTVSFQFANEKLNFIYIFAFNSSMIKINDFVFYISNSETEIFENYIPIKSLDNISTYLSNNNSVDLMIYLFGLELFKNYNSLKKWL